MTRRRDPQRYRGRLLLDFYLECYRPLRLADAAETTDKRYLVVLRHLELFLHRPPMLRDLNPRTVGKFLKAYSSGRSQVTVRTVRAHIVALWNLAAKKHYVEEFPDLPAMRMQKKIPRAWTAEQMQRIITACEMQPGEVDGIPAHAWWTALILTLFDTGLRLGAMMRCLVSDVDLERGQLHARAETQKQRADQLFALHSQTVEAIRRTLGPPRELLFPWPLGWHSLFGRYGQILQRAGLPHGRRDKFHKIRRTSATLAAIAMGKAAATEHLGHSNPAITEVYLDRSQMPVLDVANHLPRPKLSRVDGQNTSNAHSSNTSKRRTKRGPEAPLAKIDLEKAPGGGNGQPLPALREVWLRFCQQIDGSDKIKGVYAGAIRGDLDALFAACRIADWPDFDAGQIVLYYGKLFMRHRGATVDRHKAALRHFLDALPAAVKELPNIRALGHELRVDSSKRGGRKQMDLRPQDELAVDLDGAEGQRYRSVRRRKDSQPDPAEDDVARAGGAIDAEEEVPEWRCPECGTKIKTRTCLVCQARQSASRQRGQAG